jgi:hypothetical protein
VRVVLCFIDAQFRLLAKPFDIDGVLVTWSRALCERLRAPGDLDAGRCEDIYKLLMQALLPAA